VCVYTQHLPLCTDKERMQESALASERRYTHTHTHTHAHTHTPTHDLSHLYCRCLDEYPRCTHIHTDTHTQTHKHRHTHTDTHKHINAHTHIRVYSGMRATPQVAVLSSCTYVCICDMSGAASSMCYMPQCYYVCHDASTYKT